MCDRAGAMCSAVRKSFVLDQNSGQNLAGASTLQVLGTKLEVAAAPGAAQCHSRQGIKESWSACSGSPVIFLFSMPTSAHTEVPKSPSWLVPRSLELPPKDVLLTGRPAEGCTCLGRALRAFKLLEACS